MGDRAYAATTLGLLMLAAVLCAVLPSRAGAAVTACPTAVATAEPAAPDVVVELRELRREQADACAAVAGRLDVLDTGTTAVRERLANVRDDTTATVAGLADVEDAVRELAGETGPTGPNGPAGTDADPTTVKLAGADARQLFSLRYIAAMLLGAAIFASCAALLRRAWGF